MTDKKPKNKLVRGIRMLINEPRFTMKAIWVNYLLMAVARRQKFIDRVLSYVTQDKDFPLSAPAMTEPVPSVDEHSMFMCITLNTANLLELHGVVAIGQPDLVAQIAELSKRTKVMFVACVSDIKNAILAEHQKKISDEFMLRKLEKAKWN